MKSKNLLIFVGVGFELIGIMLVAIFLGRYFDETYSLKGLAIAGAVLLGLGMWLVHILVLMKRLLKQDDDSQY